ncbi:hypothetical protein QEZ54_08615 [Catellatospora sp. KI3]|uniref:hypothetical protein n=1 Tax=Catellatospora sp. KI3 TaxID=3041620 RepID=UPI0024823446|nr:hypothetical protein [Catellatospora sp. KI3]MDI1461024.1 hypothetical protein [Catellatospora sp. KI3]
MAAADVGAAFDRFWAAYPKRVGKADARRAWDKIAKAEDADFDAIIAGAERYRDDGARRRGGDQYTAHPGTWLRAERWLDELTPADRTPALSTADQKVRAGLAVAAMFAEREAQQARGELE